eukprot:snap_masked-scaffold_5-processed-gene-20.58-mRNA-1 protein AED:1.00 eAED:1.00 QI:0/-1/0/0/-1/1/1/0/385
MFTRKVADIIKLRVEDKKIFLYNEKVKLRKANQPKVNKNILASVEATKHNYSHIFRFLQVDLLMEYFTKHHISLLNSLLFNAPFLGVLTFSQDTSISTIIFLFSEIRTLDMFRKIFIPEKTLSKCSTTELSDLFKALSGTTFNSELDIKRYGGEPSRFDKRICNALLLQAHQEELKLKGNINLALPFIFPITKKLPAFKLQMLQKINLVPESTLKCDSRYISILFNLVDSREAFDSRKFFLHLDDLGSHFSMAFCYSLEKVMSKCTRKNSLVVDARDFKVGYIHTLKFIYDCMVKYSTKVEAISFRAGFSPHFEALREQIVNNQDTTQKSRAKVVAIFALSQLKQRIMQLGPGWKHSSTESEDKEFRRTAFLPHLSYSNPKYFDE